MIRSSQVVKNFSTVTAEQVEAVKKLSSEEREALKSFLSFRTNRSLYVILGQANELTDNCKHVLEGTLFNRGFLNISLLYSIANLPEAFKELSNKLNLI